MSTVQGAVRVNGTFRRFVEMVGLSSLIVFLAFYPDCGVFAAESSPAVVTYLQGDNTRAEVHFTDVVALYAAGGIWRGEVPQRQLHTLEFCLATTNGNEFFSIPFAEIATVDFSWSRSWLGKDYWTHLDNPLAISVHKNDGTTISSGPTNSGVNVVLRLKQTASSNLGERHILLNHIGVTPTPTNNTSGSMISIFQVDRIRFSPGSGTTGSKAEDRRQDH